MDMLSVLENKLSKRVASELQPVAALASKAKAANRKLDFPTLYEL
ncbi:hypothetical protein J2T09_002699 [Neorhizobium huautlense]|uniref:Transposase n=1 Tax=Neorhizobium huautlense TaxID=67774 RepID=A0ABT9PW41_9HYPH|nr:hypothetical protein [Neorhizobium huautlense]MDP9837939.1 hypothetical protein [Neorhizobium huautlense]